MTRCKECGRADLATRVCKHDDDCNLELCLVCREKHERRRCGDGSRILDVQLKSMARAAIKALDKKARYEGYAIVVHRSGATLSARGWDRDGRPIEHRTAL